MKFIPRDGEECLLTSPCTPCLNVRSRVFEHAGRDFPSLGAHAHQAITENV